MDSGKRARACSGIHCGVSPPVPRKARSSSGPRSPMTPMSLTIPTTPTSVSRLFFSLSNKTKKQRQVFSPPLFRTFLRFPNSVPFSLTHFYNQEKDHIKKKKKTKKQNKNIFLLSFLRILSPILRSPSRFLLRPLPLLPPSFSVLVFSLFFFAHLLVLKAARLPPQLWPSSSGEPRAEDGDGCSGPRGLI